MSGSCVHGFEEFINQSTTACCTHVLLRACSHAGVLALERMAIFESSFHVRSVIDLNACIPAHTSIQAPAPTVSRCIPRHIHSPIQRLSAIPLCKQPAPQQPPTLDADRCLAQKLSRTPRTQPHTKPSVSGFGAVGGGLAPPKPAPNR